MSRRIQDSISVIDRTNRRQFIRAGSGLLLAGVAAVAAGQAKASDCDRGGAQSRSSDQDAGEEADPKGCQQRNIISSHEPSRTDAFTVRTVKA